MSDNYHTGNTPRHIIDLCADVVIRLDRVSKSAWQTFDQNEYAQNHLCEHSQRLDGRAQQVIGIAHREKREGENAAGCVREVSDRAAESEQELEYILKDAIEVYRRAEEMLERWLIEREFATQNLNDAMHRLQVAEAREDADADAVRAARAELEQAKRELAECERQVTYDEDGNEYRPDCSGFRRAVDQAHRHLGAAESELERARQERRDAQANLQRARRRYNRAVDCVERATAAFRRAKSAVQQAEFGRANAERAAGEAQVASDMVHQHEELCKQMEHCAQRVLQLAQAMNLACDNAERLLTNGKCLCVEMSQVGTQGQRDIQRRMNDLRLFDLSMSGFNP